MRVVIAVVMAALLLATGASASEQLRGKHRPGCGRFCKEAGALGGGGIDPSTYPVTIPPQTLDGTRDRIVGIRATCNLETDCVGAIILNGHRVGEYGRANLRIPAQTTAKVPVGITRRAIRILEEIGKKRKVKAIVQVADADQPLAYGEDLKIVPPRR